jgi:Fe-S-cluster containining protein
MTEFNSPDYCTQCTAKCCRYIMFPIDTPRSRADFENIRWYVSHENITIHVEKHAWHMHVETRCQHLTADNRCGIYEKRPQICREHNPSSCEFHYEYVADKTFRTLDELDAYIADRFKGRKKSGGPAPTDTKPAEEKPPEKEKPVTLPEPFYV